MCSQQSKGAKRPQKSFNRADAFFIKITRFHAVLKPIFRSLKPFQAFSSLLNLRARDFSFYMNTYNRDDLIVILAGYSKEMAEFLTANSGLKSRFPNIIEFPDYTGEELLAIAKLQAGGKGYTLDERCDANLLAYFNAVQLTRARDAGNGRLARNKVEEAILNQSRRLVAQPEADLCLLLPEDFQLDDVGGV